MPQSFGRGPNQAPLNQFLGRMASVDFVTPVPVLISSAYAVTAADRNKILVVSGITTITLPLAADIVKIPEPFMIAIKAATGSTVTIARSGSDTIETVAGNKSMTANTGLWFFPVSSTAWEAL